MSVRFNIIIIMNSKGLDTSCVANVHRLPLVQALAHGIEGRGSVLLAAAPVSVLTAPFDDIGRLAKLFSGFRLERKEKNLFLFTPSVPLPISLAERWHPALKLCRRHLRRQFLHVLQRLNFNPNTPRVLWVTHPFHVHYVGLIDEEAVLYECYDDFVLFGQKMPDEQVQRAEYGLAKKSDVILATARSLLERLQQINPETHYFPNASDFGLFSKARMRSIPVAKEMKMIPKPVIGFMGSISDWYDYDLLHGVIGCNPHWSFVFVGQVEETARRDIKQLSGYGNVYLLGWKDYYSLPTYLKGFDVVILPYKVNRFMRSVNPNKLYQFMAAGLTAVSTPVPEVKQFDGLVEVGEGVRGFAAAIERALAKKGTEAVNALVSMAVDNSWEERVKMAVGLIEEELSVPVV